MVNTVLTSSTIIDDNDRTVNQTDFENLLQADGHNAIGVIYYDIGKSAIIDYPHGTSTATSLKTELLDSADKAGNIRTKNIALDFTNLEDSTNNTDSENITGNIDYTGDIDWYKITCTPGTYVLTSTADTGLDIDLDFCNSAGTVLTEEYNTGAVNKTVQLVGTEYYIKVFAKSTGTKTKGEYTLTWQAQ